MGPGFGYVLILALLPQLLLTGVALVCALLPLLRPGERIGLYRWLAVIALLGAVAACGFQLYGMRLNRNGIGVSLWNGGFVVDHFSIFVTVTACVIGLVTCFISDTYMRRLGTRTGAFFALLLLGVVAVTALGGEHEMITLFIALQLLLCVLVSTAALLKPVPSSAAVAWRLFRDGAVASALVLFGVTLLYGVTGSDNLTRLGSVLPRAAAVAAAGVALLLVGLMFFCAMFPFARWPARLAEALPGAPAGFLVAIGTSGGAVALLRATDSGLAAGSRLWTPIAAGLVTAALLVAAVLALRAVRLSGVIGALVSGQTAMLVLATLPFGKGSLGAPAQGPTAFLFALAVFDFGILAAYAAVAVLQNAGLPGSLTNLRGLAHRNQVAALLLSFGLATLAGIPPLAGFLGRLFVVLAAFDAGYGWLAIVALLAGIVPALVVVRLIAAMYAEAGDQVPFTVAATPRLGRIATMTCCLAGVALTVLAEPLLLLSRGGAGPIP